MAFLESPRFPIDINYGSVGGPVFKTDIITYGNGTEYRNSLWSIPLNRYDIRYAVKTRADLLNIYEFFLAQKGKANGFRIKDLWDYTSAQDGKSAPTSTDVTIGTGNGAITTFQLIKKYTKGGETLSRNIKKPVSSTILIKVNSVLKTEGTDYTVNYTTGVVTFTAAPTSGHSIQAGFQFDVPVRFDTDDLGGVQLLLYTTAGTDLASLESIPLIEIR